MTPHLDLSSNNYKVEHPVTEEIHGGLDLVELMINQAIAQSDTGSGLPSDSLEMQQATYDTLHENSRAAGRSHAIEGRIYAENPYEGFNPFAWSPSTRVFRREWSRLASR